MTDSKPFHKFFQGGYLMNKVDEFNSELSTALEKEIERIMDNKMKAVDNKMKAVDDHINHLIDLKLFDLQSFFPITEWKSQNVSNIDEIIQRQVKKIWNQDSSTLVQQVMSALPDHCQKVFNDFESRISKRMDDMVNQNQRMTCKISECLELKGEFNILSGNVDSKVSILAFEEMSKRFNEYAKISHIKMVSDKLELKCDNGEFEVVKTRQQAASEAMSGYLDNQKKNHKEIEELKVSMEGLVKELGRRFKESNSSTGKQMDTVGGNIRKLEDQIKAHSILSWEQNQKVWDELAVKLGQDEEYKLKMMIHAKASSEELQRMMGRVQPLVTKAETDIKKYEDTFNQITMMIARFDEILTQKANKTSVAEFEQEVAAKYVQKSDYTAKNTDYDEKFEQAFTQLYYQKHLIEGQNENVLSVLMEKVDKEISSQMKIYQDVTKQFKKFFTSENLQKQLDAKSNRREVKQLLQTKATFDDLQQSQELIDHLYQRIVHLSILQVETCRTLLPIKSNSSIKNEQTEQGKIKKVETLLTQCQIAARWIRGFQTPLVTNQNNFEGGGFGTKNLVIPNEIYDFQNLHYKNERSPQAKNSSNHHLKSQSAINKALTCATTDNAALSNDMTMSEFPVHHHLLGLRGSKKTAVHINSTFTKPGGVNDTLVQQEHNDSTTSLQHLQLAKFDPCQKMYLDQQQAQGFGGNQTFARATSGTIHDIEIRQNPASTMNGSGYMAHGEHLVRNNQMQNYNNKFKTTPLSQGFNGSELQQRPHTAGKVGRHSSYSKTIITPNSYLTRVQTQGDTSTTPNHGQQGSRGPMKARIVNLIDEMPQSMNQHQRNGSVGGIANRTGNHQNEAEFSDQNQNEMPHVSHLLPKNSNKEQRNGSVGNGTQKMHGEGGGLIFEQRSKSLKVTRTVPSSKLGVKPKF